MGGEDLEVFLGLGGIMETPNRLVGVPGGPPGETEAPWVVSSVWLWHWDYGGNAVCLEQLFCWGNAPLAGRCGPG